MVPFLEKGDLGARSLLGFVSTGGRGAQGPSFGHRLFQRAIAMRGTRRVHGRVCDGELRGHSGAEGVYLRSGQCSALREHATVLARSVEGEAKKAEDGTFLNAAAGGLQRSDAK